MPESYDNNMDVSPESMREVASSIREIGNTYNEKIQSVYSKIKEMNQYWQGAEYEAFNSKAESHRAQLESLGTLISTTIPKDLETAADNYTGAQNSIRDMLS